jgi:hypothetical protein
MNFAHARRAAGPFRGRYETLCPVGTTTELPAIRSVDHGLKAKERRAPGQC